MAAIMSTLHEDHDNTRQLLDVLERQCNILAEGDNPDYDLMEEVVEYCLAYPNMYHHPKEDAVYERLRRRSPEAVTQIGSLQEQHHELQQLTQRLGDTVRELGAEVFLPREESVTVIREFIDFYRDHIEWEETTFFPVAEQSLTAADWAELEDQLGSPTDPLFGSPAKDQYLAIRKDILRAAKAD